MDHKSELEITAWENKCWVCGKEGYVTSHHTLSKHLKPIKNFICPVCEDCHKKINRKDTRGIVSFAYKIQRSFSELTSMTRNLLELIKKK